MNASQPDPTEPRVHSITDAAEAASIESRKRLRAYVIKMAFRVVFFVAGALLAHAGYYWWGLAMLVIATILPWVAVMGANLIKDPETSDEDASYVTAPLLPQLGANARPDGEQKAEADHGAGEAGRAEPDAPAAGTTGGSASAGSSTADSSAAPSNDDFHGDVISGEWAEDDDLDAPHRPADPTPPHHHHHHEGASGA